MANIRFTLGKSSNTNRLSLFQFLERARGAPAKNHFHNPYETYDTINNAYRASGDPLAGYLRPAFQLNRSYGSSDHRRPARR